MLNGFIPQGIPPRSHSINLLNKYWMAYERAWTMNIKYLYGFVHRKIVLYHTIHKLTANFRIYDLISD